MKQHYFALHRQQASLLFPKCCLSFLHGNLETNSVCPVLLVVAALRTTKAIQLSLRQQCRLYRRSEMSVSTLIAASAWKYRFEVLEILASEFLFCVALYFFTTFERHTLYFLLQCFYFPVIVIRYVHLEINAVLREIVNLRQLIVIGGTAASLSKAPECFLQSCCTQ